MIKINKAIFFNLSFNLKKYITLKLSELIIIGFLSILVIPNALSQKYKKLTDYNKNNIKIGILLSAPNKSIIENQNTQTSSIKSGIRFGLSIEYLFNPNISLSYSSNISYENSKLNISESTIYFNDLVYSSFLGIKFISNQFNYNKYFVKLGLDFSIYKTNIIHNSKEKYKVFSADPTWLYAIPPILFFDIDDINTYLVAGIGIEYDFMNNLEAHIGTDFGYSLNNDIYSLAIDGKNNSENKFKAFYIMLYLKINYKFRLKHIL